MKVDERIITRFNELLVRADQLISGRKVSDHNKYYDDDYHKIYHNESPNYVPRSDTVNKQDGIQWATSSINLLKQIFGENNDYYISFKDKTEQLHFDNNLSYFNLCLGAIKAAKEDYENGYLFDTRTLIEAEVFDDFLEQSEHLLSQNYYVASAVIVGSVLEDSLRKLCTKNGITLSAKPKLDTMNADLAKAGVYNLLKQKQITALADLRNKAAHGLGGFTKEDVEGMIKDVRRFTKDYFS